VAVKMIIKNTIYNLKGKRIEGELYCKIKQEFVWKNNMYVYLWDLH